MVWVKPDPWEVRYGFAKAYYEEHGNLNIPSKYRADGIWLAKWVNEQKQVYAGKRKGKELSDEQVRRLEAIGMEFEPYKNNRDLDKQSQDVRVPLEILAVSKQNDGKQEGLGRNSCEEYKKAV